jgi:hypothetical protein
VGAPIKRSAPIEHYQRAPALINVIFGDKVLALDDYAANRTGLLLVDPYNDLLSDGGRLWPKAKAVAEAVDLLAHLRALVEAGRRAGIVVFYVPHRRWREGN